jgi:hypothetical protein
MGHDITAYNLDKITSLRIRMMHKKSIKKEIYECLDAEEYYNSVSGNGSGRLFDRENILDALNKAKSDDVKNFLNECLNNIEKDEQLFIIFS